jgi:hypothetical protein
MVVKEGLKGDLGPPLYIPYIQYSINVYQFDMKRECN